MILMQQSADSADVIDAAAPAPAPADTATTERLEMPDRRRAGRPSNVDPALLPLMRHPAQPAPAQRMSTRHRRPALVAFVTDGASERALREGLVDALTGTPDIRRGGLRAAIAAMERAITPNVPDRRHHR